MDTETAMRLLYAIAAGTPVPAPGYRASIKVDGDDVRAILYAANRLADLVRESPDRFATR